MCDENLYAKTEKLEAQICRCTRQGLTVMPCFHAPVEMCSRYLANYGWILTTLSAHINAMLKKKLLISGDDLKSLKITNE